MKNATKKPRSKQSIEAQIIALEYAYLRAKNSNKPLYGIQGKIDNLRKELNQKKWDDHLAK